MNKIYIISLICILLLNLNCENSNNNLKSGSNKDTLNSDCDGTTQTATIDQTVGQVDLTNKTLAKRDNKEAELMALCLSGDIVAPDNLYNQILSDLTIIRNKYSGDYPIINSIGFEPPWIEGNIFILFDESISQDVIDDNYKDWDSLNEKYYITNIEKYVLDHLHEVIVGLLSEYRLNSKILSQQYASLPGVTSAEPNLYIHLSCPSNIYPRIIDNKITYLFLERDSRDEICVGTGHFIYFEVENNNPILIGHWDVAEETQPDWWCDARKNIELYRSF